MRALFLLVVAGSVACQELPVRYDAKTTAAEAGTCASAQDIDSEKIDQDIHSLISNSVQLELSRYGACDCGSPGWIRAAYLNMSVLYPLPYCPSGWQLRYYPRSCARPLNADWNTCYPVTFPVQGIQYSQVCGRIIGYQIGLTGAFIVSEGRTIDDRYVDGVSLTYGNPRQHIWTFASAIDEYPHFSDSKCRCSNVTERRPINIPSFVGNDYFCETGVPPGQRVASSLFYHNDPLWDGQTCGPTSTCCTFNKPPWFCKQLPQSTNADLEVRLCSAGLASVTNTAVELIEIYVK